MWAETSGTCRRTIGKLALTSGKRNHPDKYSCSDCLGDAGQHPDCNSRRNSNANSGGHPAPHAEHLLPTTPPRLRPPPLPSAATSEGRPTLSSQPANEYLQSYDAYISDFKMAYHAMKQGDMTKYQTVILRAHELQTKGEKLGGELSPDEEKRFADYLNKKADELAQFASQNR